jgi:hypothetical protein
MFWLSLILKLIIVLALIPVLRHVHRRTTKHQADFEAFLAQEKAEKEAENLRARTYQPSEENSEKSFSGEHLPK